MDVSIVTPVLDEPRLGAALDSILEQDAESTIEIIVIDGGSNDETVTIIDAYLDDIDELVREPDDGIYDAMNKGINHASGDVVGILNADDRYQDSKVVRRVVHTLKASGADSCYGDLVLTNELDDVVRHWRSGAFRPRKVYLGWMPPHPTFFVRRTVYEKYGGFESAYEIAADYELMLRLLLNHGVSTTYIDEVLVRMAVGGRSNASPITILKANREVARAWRDNDLTGGRLASVCKPIRKLPQYLWALRSRSD